jgi:hypothetical protein
MVNEFSSSLFANSVLAISSISRNLGSSEIDLIPKALWNSSVVE